MSLHKLLYILISLLYPLSSFVLLTQQNSELRSYIIHVKKLDDDQFNNTHTITTTNYHKSFLPDTSTSNDSLLYSYKHVISGFAARLTTEEVETMKKKDGFISAHPEKMYQLSTTRSPAFLGLHPGTGLWNQSNEGKGVIIGVVDTGIFPSHPSFRDVKMSPPPAKWKGGCEFPNKTNCNNKIIGARFFLNGSESDEYSPLDENGHGTHVASTAAGGFVENACFLGLACGTAVGMAPQAHLAIYKVFGKGDRAAFTDIVAALDAAIEDGVDVLSISIVADDSSPFYDDYMAIASFAAVQKGIFVSVAAGNNGPKKWSLSYEATWVLTVGASTIDRRLVATAKLGNGQEFDGESLYQPKEFQNASGKMLPLVYRAYCDNLSSFDVKGKVVLCDGFWQNKAVKLAGGAAAILANLEVDGFTIDVYYDRFLPGSQVSYMAGQKIKAYINSTKSPTATIFFKGTVIGDPLDPIVASFSSRGPSLQTPGVLKPDIIGPGVNILAASPYHIDVNKDSKLTFDFMSGTSMSAPHLAGVAALLKSAHPNWTPAAIKSAIMTTADLVNAQRTTLILDEKLTPADVFATGAGHVNPSKAVDPGLVYDIEPDDYIPFLCGLGYTDEQVGIIAHKSVKCTSKIPQEQLNYPTFSVLLGSSPQTFQRTVTNVGEKYSYYIAMIFPPKGVKIVVRPQQLWFPRVDQKATYYVTFSRCGSNNITNTDSQGYLLWVSRKHTVASVVSVNFTGAV